MTKQETIEGPDALLRELVRLLREEAGLSPEETKAVLETAVNRTLGNRPGLLKANETTV